MVSASIGFFEEKLGNEEICDHSLAKEVNPVTTV